MLPLLILIVSALVPTLECHCHGAQTSYRAHFLNKRLVQENKVLLGHVFANFSVETFIECSGRCKNDCRCRSFNLPMSGKGRCELNDADNTTALVIPRRGWRYHHLEEVQSYMGDDTCWEPYENGCCSSNPCGNSTTCTETVKNGKPTFQCGSCNLNEGEIGEFCDKKSYSCIDYLVDNKTRPSGLYYVWNKNNYNKYYVYCHMKPNEFEAWTLVKWFKYEDLESFTYYIVNNKEINVESPLNYSPYVLSASTMKHLKEGIEKGGRLPQWRITCSDDKTFDDGKGDMVRSSFKTLNIMGDLTLGCHRVDYIKIRGKKCRNCEVYTLNSANGFTIYPYKTDGNCNYESDSIIPGENTFGVYNTIDRNHACVEGKSSTTQYWFGGEISV